MNLPPIVDAAAKKLIQFGRAHLLTETFLANVTYLLRVADAFSSRFSDLESLCNYEGISSLKPAMWSFLNELLPRLPVEELVFVHPWRAVFGVSWLFALLFNSR